VSAAPEPTGLEPSHLAARRAREVEARFAAAAGRMAGLPICNPALRVEAVGFREWDGGVVGVLVAPWTVSLLVLSGAAGPLAPLRAGTFEERTFPSGAYPFVPAEDEELGAYRTCSLLSPPAAIASQEDARAAALAALEALLAPSDGRPPPPAARPALSRRAFLFRGRAPAPSAGGAAEEAER
jgi:[NiFe] hydrogenase assembly HybE family chaperone